MFHRISLVVLTLLILPPIVIQAQPRRAEPPIVQIELSSVEPLPSDVAANLSEWCLKNYKTPNIIDGYSDGERKVLRGGSFLSFQSYTDTI